MAHINAHIMFVSRGPESLHASAGLAGPWAGKSPWKIGEI